MSIITEYSLWFALLCGLVGALFSFALYFRNREIEYDHRASIIMASLRGVSVALIAFLLLAPMVRCSVKQVDKPLLIFAFDNSESMAMTKDSAFYRHDFSEKLDQLVHAFGDRYDVKTYFVGEQNILQDASRPVNLTFPDKTTNLSSLFNEVGDLYASHNVGAMVLVSDGIFNTGSNPQYAAQNLKFPVHTVATGDTSVQTDIAIADIVHNRQTFLGNYFPVEIKVSASRLAGKDAKLTVYQKDNEVFSKDIHIQGNRHFETVKFALETKSKGLQHYRVVISELPGEVTYQNNTANFYIEVVDQREKIAIVYYAPHPDVAAIKQALETSDKYEVETFAAGDFNKDPNAYSLFILHQLPSNKAVATTLLDKIQKNGISALYIIGPQSNLTAFNQSNAGLAIQLTRGGQPIFNDATPTLNPNFLAFSFSEEAKQMIKTYTPISTFFGNYNSSVGNNVFMYQKINNVNTNYPLISFQQQGMRRVGVIAGTDIWRWRMQNYLRVQNFDAFDEIINKIALYMSVKGDNSFFRVHAAELYSESAAVEISAEVYSQAYELINTPDVRFKLKDADGKEFVSQFSKQNNAYSLNLGRLAVGDYTWEAETKVDGTLYKKSGHFTVQEVRLESMSLVADHNLLRNISQDSHGQFFTIDQLEQVEKAIKENDSIKPVVSYVKKYNLLLNSWIYLAAIILLLGIEWFMRKWGGGY